MPVEGVYIRGGGGFMIIIGCIFCIQVDGSITGGGGVISASLW